MDFLRQSFEEHSLIWVLISAGLGGLIGAAIRFTFENVLAPSLQLARSAKATLRKYTHPLLRAADALDRRLENLLKFSSKHWFDDPNDDYYRLSTLYVFGSYFGWCKILENEAFLEYVTSSSKARRFGIQFNRVFKGITGFYYFQDVGEAEMPLADIEAATVPRLALTAIGELMIKKPGGDSAKSLPPSVIDFVEFVRLYNTSSDFVKWFSYVEKLFAKLDEMTTSPRWNRLVVFAANLRAFVVFLDPRSKQTAPRKFIYLARLNPKVRKRLQEELEEAGFSALVAE